MLSLPHEAGQVVTKYLLRRSSQIIRLATFMPSCLHYLCYCLTVDM